LRTIVRTLDVLIDNSCIHGEGIVHLAVRQINAGADGGSMALRVDPRFPPTGSAAIVESSGTI